MIPHFFFSFFFWGGGCMDVAEHGIDLVWLGDIPLNMLKGLSPVPPLDLALLGLQQRCAALRASTGPHISYFFKSMLERGMRINIQHNPQAFPPENVLHAEIIPYGNQTLCISNPCKGPRWSHLIPRHVINSGDTTKQMYQTFWIYTVGTGILG